MRRNYTIYIMTEALLLKYRLDDATLEKQARDMPIPGMSGMVPVGIAADVGIRDDLIKLYIILETISNPVALNTAIRDTILERKITFASVEYADELPPQTFAAKLPDILNPAFIKSKIEAYQLMRPYKYSLLVLSCVAGKLSKQLTSMANEHIIKLGGHQLVYTKSKYCDDDFKKTEQQILSNLKIIFDNIFAALSKLAPKNIADVDIAPIKYPAHTMIPATVVPTTSAESAAEIERFLINNRAHLNQIEQFYIQKAAQINNVIHLVMRIYATYFGAAAAAAAYGDCVDY